MIYTIGHIESYEKYFRGQGIPRKKGRTKNYQGGSVWKTYEEARGNRYPEYSVYGVLADWDKDIVEAKDANWHDLLVDSELVKIDNKGEVRDE